MPEQNNCWQAGNEISEKSSEIGKLIMRRSAGTWTTSSVARMALSPNKIQKVRLATVKGEIGAGGGVGVEEEV